MVVDRPRRLRGGHAVHEVERPDPGLDRVGRQDRLGDLVVEAGCGSLRMRARHSDCGDAADAIDLQSTSYCEPANLPKIRASFVEVSRRQVQPVSLHTR